MTPPGRPALHAFLDLGRLVGAEPRLGADADPKLLDAFVAMGSAAWLRGLSPDRFAEGAAAHLAALAAAVPFRSGQQAALLAHFGHLAHEAGQLADLSAVPRAAWDSAHDAYAKAMPLPLCWVLQRAMQPMLPIAASDAMSRAASLESSARADVLARVTSAASGRRLCLRDAMLSWEYLSVGLTGANAPLAAVRRARGAGVGVVGVLLLGGEEPGDEIHAIHQGAMRALDACGAGAGAADARAPLPAGSMSVALRTSAASSAIHGLDPSSLEGWGRDSGNR